MDSSAVDIEFDAAGQCSYCCELEMRLGTLSSGSAKDRAEGLHDVVRKIKRGGRGKPYDCIIGLSGGADSSWALVHAVRLGLRPLAVHMDNGWNSELAVHNISRLVERLGIDLYTHVIDWDEYRGLMKAFLDADVIDVELLYDNAMLAVNYRAARRHGVKYILSGSNSATEGMRMPPGWNWNKYDLRNIRALGRRRGVSLSSFPGLGTLNWIWYSRVRGIQWVSFLDFLEYDKAAAIEELVREFGYKPYPYKHYESVFTRFYQGYLLPEKFGVDKRRLHLSSLIVSGGLTREEALRELENPPYVSDGILRDDINFFLKKMGWTREELDDYLRRPPRSHAEFPTERPLFEWLMRAYQRLRQPAGATR